MSKNELLIHREVERDEYHDMVLRLLNHIGGDTLTAMELDELRRDFDDMEPT